MTIEDVLAVPGYRAGSWALDPAHSTVGFAVRHLMISEVRGVFAVKSATITAPENPFDARVRASVDVSSLETQDPERNAHLLSPDFLDAARFPTMEFVSTGARADGAGYVVDGDLTIRGVTRPVSFDFEFGGFADDPWGGYKAGARARTVIDREDFGLVWNVVLEAGGILVGRQVEITLDLEGSFIDE